VDRLTQRLREARRAWQTLSEAVSVDEPSTLERDGAIQRFKYTFEATWKAAQLFLDVHEGLTARSPKSCIRSLGQAGLLDEAVAALAMADDRNLTVHTYVETLAATIFERLPEQCGLMGALLDRMGRWLAN